MAIVTNLNALVMNAASSYIAANSSTFKSTEVGPVGPNGSVGAQGLQGIAGINGADGEDLTIEQIQYNGNGTFTWHFSDETTYTTPNMIGPQGLQGSKGDKGDTGVSVHHTKGTSTTNSEGDFNTPGEVDTYTMYGDADETMVLGWFRVANGHSAYSYALAGGYIGTELEFQESLSSLTEILVEVEEAVVNAQAALAQVANKVDKDDVVDTFISTALDAPLSANAGRVLYEKIDELTLEDIEETATNKWFSSTEKNKLSGIEVGATADQTGIEIKSLYEGNPDTNAYTDAEKLKLAGIINDTTASTVTAYSGSKVQEMHNAQAATMAALGTAQGEIVNTNTPVFASIPKYPLVGVLDFTTVIGSTNTSMFEIDATTNLFAFKQAASYTFLSEVVIKSNVSAARVLTFNLVDSDTDVVLMTQSKNMVVASGNTENFSISTLLIVDVAPKNVRVEVSCSGTGYEFRSFNSILTSSVGVGSESVDSINIALGELVTGVLV